MGQTLALQKSYWENWKESKWAQGRTDMPKYAIFEIPLLEIHDLEQKEVLTQTILSKIQALVAEIEGEILWYSNFSLLLLLLIHFWKLIIS